MGDRVRALVKRRGDLEISPLTELLLFLAARHQLLTELLRDTKGYKVILCDRYAESSVAYQGYGRGLDPDMIEKLNALATEGHRPDLVVLLDLPPEAGLWRKGVAKNDHFEEAELGFHQRVREGYLKMAREDPARWLVIDATLPAREVERIVWERIGPLVNMVVH